MLPKSIEERIINLMVNNPEMEIEKAIELGFKEEQLFLEEMFEQKTQRAKDGLNIVRKNVYISILSNSY